MPRPLTRLETYTLASRRTITLLDDAGDDVRVGDDWFSVAPNCVTVLSGGATDHFARMTIEIWDVSPPPLEGWESSRAGRVRLDSGYLEIQPTDTHVLRIGLPGHFQVRAYTSGRAQIAALTPRSGIEELRGMESFLIQFWPAGPSGDAAVPFAGD